VAGDLAGVGADVLGEVASAPRQDLAATAKKYAGWMNRFAAENRALLHKGVNECIGLISDRTAGIIDDVRESAARHIGLLASDFSNAVVSAYRAANGAGTKAVLVFVTELERNKQRALAAMLDANTSSPLYPVRPIPDEWNPRDDGGSGAGFAVVAVPKAG
jgi:hypothetical protein